MTHEELEEAVEALWSLFRESDQRLDRRFQETDGRIDHGFREIRRSLQDAVRGLEETKHRFEDTDRRLDQRFAETDRRLDQRFEETDRRLDQRFAATDRQIEALAVQTRAAEDLFIGKWGRLVEALVKPGVAALFQARGIDVSITHPRLLSRKGGREMEIDLLLEDTDTLVVVEVKTTLKVQDVRDFLEDLAEFPRFFPKYEAYRRFGAVAALTTEEESHLFAYRQGLFVLTVGREGLVTLRNDAKFQPKDFSEAR